jgi:4a-hydroxytetrahydrobiopterin dehydratase
MTWTEKDNTLRREIRTPDFLTAYNIVSRIVAPAEALNHHPDLSFGWGYVHITLTTHDAGGITAKDRELAARIDEAVKPFAV